MQGKDLRELIDLKIVKFSERVRVLDRACRSRHVFGWKPRIRQSSLGTGLQVKQCFGTLTPNVSKVFYTVRVKKKAEYQ